MITASANISAYMRAVTGTDITLDLIYEQQNQKV
jgi:hypothetical protein